MENFININEMMKQPVVNQNYRNYKNEADFTYGEYHGGGSEYHGIGKNTDAGNSFNKQSPFILGICYVPMQEWEQVYDEDTAFSAGTLFPSLNKPFLGGGK